MAEKRSKRFEVVLMLADRQEQEAARQLGDFQQQLERETTQLQQLKAYNQDYLDKFSARREGLRGTDLVSSRGFLQRLADAEREQEATLARMEITLNKLRQLWQQKRHYRESIQNLISRFVVEEDAAVERQLQKELDDLAAQRLSR